SIAKGHLIDASYYINIALDYELDLCLMLAQAQIESHFGTAGIAKRTYNIYNIGNTDSGSYNIIHKNDIHHGIYVYAKLLKERYLVNKTTKDLLNNFVCHKGHRYASALDYEFKLSSLIKKIRYNTDIDKLYKQLIQIQTCIT
ncbi:MAG: glucosaminidase domain-containing protein, partial [Clostridia bacterium]